MGDGGLLVPAHRRLVSGIAHGHVDDERGRDDGGQVVGEPRFVADRLEPQRDRLGGAAEDRDGDGIGQADAGGADPGRKELGLDHGIDRGVAGDDQPRRRNQQERDERASRRLQQIAAAGWCRACPSRRTR